MADNSKILYLDLHTNDTKSNSIRQLDVPDVDTVTSVSQTSMLSAEDSLRELYALITEKGMDPVAHISGYIITEEPTYIPDYKNARAIADRIGRDKLLFALLENFFDEEQNGDN